MPRNDLAGLTRAPQSWEEFLVRIGGKNPHGEPNYRLVWADSVMHTIGGEWHDWPDAYSLAERGGLIFDGEGNYHESDLKPDRIVTELRQFPKYVICECDPPTKRTECDYCGGRRNGWILEKWYPAHLFGSEEWWYSQKAPNSDVPLLGPYPTNGDYEAVANCDTNLPSMDDVQEVIQRIENKRGHRIVDPSMRQKARVDEIRAQTEHRKAMTKAENVLKIRDHMSPYRSNTLESGRLREELAKNLPGIGHVGN